MFLVIALVVIFKNKKEKLRMHMSTNEEPHIEIAKYVCMYVVILLYIANYHTVNGYIN